MYQFLSIQRWPARLRLLTAATAAVLLAAAPGLAQDPAAGAMPAGGMPAGGMPGGAMPGGAMPPGAPAGGAAAPGQPAPPDFSTAWLKSGDGGMPWQIAVMFTGFWVLSAVEIAVISKSANRLERPKKKDEYQAEA